jgi:hypothetical protein
MNTLHELALPAAIHRITMLEKERDDFNKKLEAVYTTMAQIRTELASGGRLIDKQYLTGSIVIPDELRLVKQKGQRQKRNRAYHIVQKRWSLWQEQLKTGISIHALSKAWDCDHGTILFAKKRKFKARKAWNKGNPEAFDKYWKRGK